MYAMPKPISLLRPVVGPLLRAQGRRLRRVIPRLPEPAGAREGVTGIGTPIRLLIVGDSAAAGVGVGSQDEALLGRTLAHLSPHARVSFRLIARTGATVEHALRMVRGENAESFDVAILSLGANSILSDLPVGVWLSRYDALVGELRQRFGVTLVIGSGLPPMGRFPSLPIPLRWYLGAQARRYDRALRAWAEVAEDVEYLSFGTQPGDPLHHAPLIETMASDGFHPGPRIYDLWAQRASALTLRHVAGRSG